MGVEIKSKVMDAPLPLQGPPGAEASPVANVDEDADTFAFALPPSTDSGVLARQVARFADNASPSIEELEQRLIALDELPSDRDGLLSVAAALADIAVLSIRGNGLAYEALRRIASGNHAASPVAVSVLKGVNGPYRFLVVGDPRAFEGEVSKLFWGLIDDLAWQVVLGDRGHPPVQQQALEAAIGPFAVMRRLFDVLFPSTPQRGDNGYQAIIDAMHDLLILSEASEEMIVRLAIRHARPEASLNLGERIRWIIFELNLQNNVTYRFPEYPRHLHVRSDVSLLPAYLAIGVLLREVALHVNGRAGKITIEWQSDPQAIVIGSADGAKGEATKDLGRRLAYVRGLLEPIGWGINDSADDGIVRFTISASAGDITEIDRLQYDYGERNPFGPTEDGAGLTGRAYFGYAAKMQQWNDRLTAIGVAAVDGLPAAISFLEALAKSQSMYADAARLTLEAQDWLRRLSRETNLDVITREFNAIVGKIIQKIFSLTAGGDEDVAAARRLTFAVPSGPMTTLAQLLRRRVEGRTGDIGAFRHDILSATLHALKGLSDMEVSAGILMTISRWLEFDPTTPFVLSHIAHVLGLARNAMNTRRGIRFDVDIPPNLIFRDPTVASEIRETIGELVRNALKYHRESGEGLFVRVAWVVAQGVFIVEDNGTGIRDTERVWRENERETDRHPGVRGDGMGLAIVRRRINDIGGTITLESEVDQGTSFTITPGSGDVIMGDSAEPNFAGVTAIHGGDTASRRDADKGRTPLLEDSGGSTLSGGSTIGIPLAASAAAAVIPQPLLVPVSK